MLTAEIIGNLGRDAQTRQIREKNYVSFDVAHEQRNGESSETVWVSVLWYGNGGNLVQYLKRGAKVFVRGRLVPGIYTGRDGARGVAAFPCGEAQESKGGGDIEMDYRNGRVTSASVCKGPASAKSQAGGKCECNIGMTYEQLAATWKPIRRRERWTRK